MRKPLIVTAVFLLLLGCDAQNKLTNEEALKIIKEGYRDLCMNQVKRFFSSSQEGPNFMAFENYYTSLMEEGLMVYEAKTHPNGTSVIEIKEYTELAKQKYKATPENVGIMEFVPKEIVGISIDPNSNKAKVICKGDYQKTPFFKIVRSRTDCKESKGVEKEVTLVRYDTGWRLED